MRILFYDYRIKHGAIFYIRNYTQLSGSDGPQNVGPDTVWQVPGAQKKRLRIGIGAAMKWQSEVRNRLSGRQYTRAFGSIY